MWGSKGQGWRSAAQLYMHACQCGTAVGCTRRCSKQMAARPPECGTAEGQQAVHQRGLAVVHVGCRGQGATHAGRRPCSSEPHWRQAAAAANPCALEARVAQADPPPPCRTNDCEIPDERGVLLGRYRGEVAHWRPAAAVQHKGSRPSPQQSPSGRQGRTTQQPGQHSGRLQLAQPPNKTNKSSARVIGVTSRVLAGEPCMCTMPRRCCCRWLAQAMAAAQWRLGLCPAAPTTLAQCRWLQLQGSVGLEGEKVAEVPARQS